MAKRKVNWSVSEDAYDQIRLLSLFNGISMSKLIEEMAANAFQLNQKKLLRWQRQTLKLG
jgi:hypothetical protein